MILHHLSALDGGFDRVLLIAPFRLADFALIWTSTNLHIVDPLFYSHLTLQNMKGNQFQHFHKTYEWQLNLR